MKNYIFFSVSILFFLIHIYGEENSNKLSTLKCVVSRLNIRDTPSVQGKIIGLYKYNDLIEYNNKISDSKEKVYMENKRFSIIRNTHEHWISVSKNGVHGWIHGGGVQPPEVKILKDRYTFSVIGWSKEGKIIIAIGHNWVIAEEIPTRKVKTFDIEKNIVLDERDSEIDKNYWLSIYNDIIPVMNENYIDRLWSFYVTAMDTKTRSKIKLSKDKKQVAISSDNNETYTNVISKNNNYHDIAISDVVLVDPRNKDNKYIILLFRYYEETINDFKIVKI